MMELAEGRIRRKVSVGGHKIADGRSPAARGRAKVIAARRRKNGIIEQDA